mmetsp:Transcript_13036/g.23195  ORF Transcript_13036/g.23195 Transcript_13036/m.23195 type:complete len:235 (-) Transcript_13036:531-1235(-)
MWPPRENLARSRLVPPPAEAAAVQLMRTMETRSQRLSFFTSEGAVPRFSRMRSESFMLSLRRSAVVPVTCFTSSSVPVSFRALAFSALPATFSSRTKEKPSPTPLGSPMPVSRSLPDSFPWRCTCTKDCVWYQGDQSSSAWMYRATSIARWSSRACAPSTSAARARAVARARCSREEAPPLRPASASRRASSARARLARSRSCSHRSASATFCGLVRRAMPASRARRRPLRQAS